MQYKSNKGFTGWGQLGMLIVFIGAGMILGGIVQFVLGMQMVPAGTSLESLSDAMMLAMKNPQNVNKLRWIQFFSTLFMLMMPAVLFSLLTNGKEMIWMGFSKYLNFYQVALGFLIIFTANILGGPLQQWSERLVANLPSLNEMAQRLEGLYNDQVVAMSHISGTADFILVIIIMAFLPAVFEELFFRGTIQNLLVKWWKKPLLAIVFTSILFSLIHGSVYLFLTRAVLGFALGMMYHETKNIWVNIVAHFLNNAIAASQMFVLSMENKKIEVKDMDMKVEWWMGLIALFILFFLFKMLRKYSELNRMKIFTREEACKVNYQSGNPFA